MPSPEVRECWQASHLVLLDTLGLCAVQLGDLLLGVGLELLGELVSLSQLPLDELVHGGRGLFGWLGHFPVLKIKTLREDYEADQETYLGPGGYHSGQFERLGVGAEFLWWRWREVLGYFLQWRPRTLGSRGSSLLLVGVDEVGQIDVPVLIRFLHPQLLLDELLKAGEVPVLGSVLEEEHLTLKNPGKIIISKARNIWTFNSDSPLINYPA